MFDEYTLKMWRKDRDKVVRTYNIHAFKMFYERWKSRGLYNMKRPSDRAIEIAMRKIVYYLPDVSASDKAEAKRWLLAHRCHI